MTADASRRPHDGTDLWRQWTVNLVPPLLVLLDLQAGYQLVDVSCATGDRMTTHLVHGGLLLAALAFGAVAWASWRRAGAVWPEDGGDPDTRSRFMAALGVIVSIGSALVIATQWLPVFLLSPCQ